MSLSEEQVQVLADAVATWRLQDITLFFLRANGSARSWQGHLTLCFLQIYYVLTTIKEEVRTVLAQRSSLASMLTWGKVSIIHPQRWSIGIFLFLAIRYGILVTVALQLARNYRTYFSISPTRCKTIMIIYDATYYGALMACNASLGLFLSALLQARKRFLIPIVALCVIPSLYAFIIGMLSDVQYPAEEVFDLDIELGYPCYVPSSEAWVKSTARGLARDIRQYISFATATLLLVLAIVTLVVRYKGQHGQLIHILRNDGGLYYVALVVLRYGYSILNSPAILSVEALDSNPAYILLTVANAAIIPILAQRLMINIRKVDFVGSRPTTSTLLFAHTAQTSEGRLETEEGDYSAHEEAYHLRQRPAEKRDDLADAKRSV